MATVPVVLAAGLAPMQARADFSQVGLTDPDTQFPSYYADSNGLALQPCLDGLPLCLGSRADLLDNGADGEGFYSAVAADVGVMSLGLDLEAAYLAEDEEITFQRSQYSAKSGLRPGSTYIVTDPYGTNTCKSDSTGAIKNNACRFETGGVPGDFASALRGRLGPFLTWDTFGSTGAGAPPAGYIGDNATPHKVVGSPSGFNKFRVEGPGINTTGVDACPSVDGPIADCGETDLFVVSGKVLATGPAASTSAKSFDYGNTATGGSRSLTYTSFGSGNAVVDSVSLSGPGAADFAVTEDCSSAGTVNGPGLAPGSSCTIGVAFTPRVGESTATLTIADNTLGSPRTVALSGRSLPVTTLDRTSATFGSQKVATTSTEDIVTVTNTGVAPLSATTSLSGTGASHFTVTSNGCTTPVDPGKGCEISVAFTPTSTGTKSASLLVTDNAGVTSSVTLSGTGTKPLTSLSPAPLAFADTATGTTTTQPLTVHNGGSASGVITSISATGANAADFAYTPTGSTCVVGANVAPGASCLANVRFQPSAPGVRSATLAVVVDGVTSTVALSGTGVTPPDTTAPSVPTGLRATASGSTVGLTWTPSTDNVGVTGYAVYRDAGSAPIARVGGTSTSFTDVGVTNGTHTYRVTAVDAAGNGSALSAAASVSVDAQAPVLAATSPASGGTTFATTANVTATFSEAVQGVSTTTFTLKNPAGTLISAVVSRNGTTNQWIFNPAATLLADTRYTVTLTGGTTAIRDLAGNPLATRTWTFTTGPAPTVTTTTPASAGTTFATTANVTATFSEAVQGVSTTTFTLKNPAGTLISAVVSRNGTTNQWILNPAATLLADTRYTVTLTGGTTAIRDLAGNPLATRTWTFTTGPAPTVIARSPGTGALRVSRVANVTATFSEAVQGVNTTTFTLKNPAGTLISAVVSRNGTTNQWILNPGVTLSPNTVYTARLTGGTTAIRDLAGNPLTSIAWTFTTGP
ncbi:Ig-like domain-containing protein [Terrabacter sp. BE26]|uniref:Ig-like domain-containing protein n=1 Tax=Terrabacter sp. BE26 TaxID=2898152 RepID=UPI0035BE3BAD